MRDNIEIGPMIEFTFEGKCNSCGQTWTFPIQDNNKKVARANFVYTLMLKHSKCLEKITTSQSFTVTPVK